MARRNNYAFIDAQNLHLGVRDLGWEVDMQRFHRYLMDKYGVTKAFLFIGYKPGNEKLYTYLQSVGYVCVFKPTLVRGGVLKGNCDAELVLHAMIEFSNYEKAIIVTGDGDFRCLAEYLMGCDKLEKIIAPNEQKCSALLRSLVEPDQNILDGMSSLKGKVEKKYYP